MRAPLTARSRLVIDEAQLKTLDAQQLRKVVRLLVDQLQWRDHEIAFKQATIDKITHEMVVLKRLKFVAKSGHFSAEQKSRMRSMNRILERQAVS